MAASYLTTDIIVIIALVVVLILVGVIAFLIHFYWTKIGVAEIWNTARWSSMRSSLYQSVRRRLSRTSASKMSMERPLSAASDYTNDKDMESNSYYSEQKTRPSVMTSYVNPSSIAAPQYRPTNSVSSVAYNNPTRISYVNQVGQPMQTTRIHSMNEYDYSYYDRPGPVEKQRF